MKRLLLLIALLVAAAPVMAQATYTDGNPLTYLTIGPANWTTTPGTVVIPIYYDTAHNGTNANGWASQAAANGGLVDFEMQVQVSGAQGLLLTADSAFTHVSQNNGFSGTQMASLVATYFPTANFAFTNFADPSTGGSQNASRVTFEIGDSNDSGAHAANFSSFNANTIVGLVAFTYSVPESQFINGTVNVNLMSEDQSPTPEYTDNGLNVYDGVASDPGVNIAPVPEPATMGLLGLGLVGLMIRRRKA